MGNEKLLKYIESLSKEERERFRELIEDALHRDRVLSETFNTLNLHANDYVNQIRNILENAICLQTNLSVLNELLSENRESSDEVSQEEGKEPVWN